MLHGRLRKEALAVVAAIVRGIGAAAIRLKRGNASLGVGSAGLAVLYHYLAKRQPSMQYAADRFLDAAVSAVASSRLPASLYNGFTGVAWALEHVSPSLTGEPDGIEEVDRVLETYLACPRWRGEFDLTDGLVGFGVYALERLPRPSAARCLTRVIEHLDDVATRTPDGVTWLSGPDRNSNLGVAHGVPGVIAFLGAACTAGVNNGKAQRLLRAAVCWLLSQKLSCNSESTFSYRVGPATEPAPARSAWCYGDPGIAAALLMAARGAGEPAWETEAVAIALRAARRPPEQAGVRDAGLCHGAASLAHVFNRIFQATGDVQIGAAARFWFRRTLAMRQPGRGIAGYQALRFPNDRPVWKTDPGLVTGVAGIALALQSACTNIEPEWDRFLLLSMRSMADMGDRS